MMQIKYSGKYPNYCSGALTVVVDEKTWVFPPYSLLSGGGASCRGSEEIITQGEWSIREYPEDFPENLKETLLEMVNEEIPPGCCGGCL
jgi:hypothetical protein